MLRSHLGYLVRLESHPRQRRWLDREWLGRPILVSGDGIIGGDLTFLNLVYGFSGQAVEEEQQALLGPLRYGWDLLAIPCHVDQSRRGGQVIIPVIVMRGLKVPFKLPCSGIQGYQLRTIQVCPF